MLNDTLEMRLAKPKIWEDNLVDLTNYKKRKEEGEI